MTAPARATPVHAVPCRALPGRAGPCLVTVALLLLASTANATPPYCTAADGTVSRCVTASALRACDAAESQLAIVYPMLQAERRERVRLAEVVLPQLSGQVQRLTLALRQSQAALAAEEAWGPRWAWTALGAAGLLVLGAVVTVVLVVAQ